MNLDHSPAPEYYICAKKIFEAGEEHITRIHARSVLILMISGTLRFLEDGHEISLQKGEYYIQRQRLLQEGVSLSDPPVYYFLEFNGHFSENGRLPLRGVFDPNIIVPLCEEAQSSGNGFFQNAQMNRILSILCNDPLSGSSTAHLIRRYIDSNYAEQPTLSDISKRFGYSEDYVTRLFKREFNTTPHKHLTDVRLKQAVWLLRNTNLPIERISVAVGYADFSAFWRSFKKKYTLSPGEMRKTPHDAQDEAEQKKP